MATNMFSAGPARNKPLVEFRAGKMMIRGKTVTPDTRKGLVQLVQSQDDGLLHFYWKDRTTGQVETDLILFPEEATFKRVKQCTTGRVYVLQWKATPERRLFFWMQEPSEDKDEDNVSKLNKSINDPPAPESSEREGGFGGLDQNQLLQMMGGLPPRRSGGSGGSGSRSGGSGSSGRSAGSGSSAASSASSASSSGLSSDLLQNVLSNLGVGTEQPSPQGSSQTHSQAQPQTQPATLDSNLSDIMSPEALLPLLSDPTIQEQLLPFLPEGGRSREELMEVIRSPQFQQALLQFNSALRSGQLSQLMPMFGLPANVGGPQGGVNALLQALQAQSGTPPRTTQDEQTSSSQPKDDESKEEKKDESKKDEGQ